MIDKNLISIDNIIRKLQHQKMVCSWEDVDNIQSKITFYQSKIDQGILYEPAF